MELRFVRAFLAVAEEQHFGRAAERLRVAQPALSYQVKTLERELGVPLFERTTRRVELTPAGRRFLRHAHRMVAAADRAAVDMERLRAGLAGRVAVGFIGTATYDLLPRVARAVRDELPGIELQLRGELLSPQLLDGLSDLTHDLVVHRPGRTPRDGIVTRVLRAEPLVAALPARHPLAGAASIRLAQLAGEPFVIHPSTASTMHEQVLAACAAAGFRPPALIEVAETATLVVFVAAGLGVALVPAPVRSLALDGVAYRPIASAPTIELLLSVRAGDADGPVGRVAQIVASAVA